VKLHLHLPFYLQLILSTFAQSSTFTQSSHFLVRFVIPSNYVNSQFCSRYDPNFTEDMLDMHYWKECPMLTSCKFCGQVVEVMTMNQHMLEECEKRAKFGKGFVADLDENMNKCPLCQITVAPLTETGWKQHLLRGKGCVKNPRTSHLRKKQTM
jgi:hypothetical protein